MQDAREIDLAARIRAIPDFPKPGILFRDIMPLLQDAQTLRAAVDRMAEWSVGRHVDAVLGAESRGFILGSALAYALNAGFVCARKPGKLPYATVTESYELEYGTDALEVHEDAITPGMNILVHDDLLATGGTAAAKVRLVQKMGGNVVGATFLVELVDLHGRDKLPGVDVFTLVTF